MVNALRFFKVAQLPQSPLPNSAYFVLREDDTFDFHITDLSGNVKASAAGGAASSAWSDITGKPAAFPPSDHSHPAQVVGWDDVQNKPAAFPPSDHSHPAQVVGWDDITGKPAAFPPTDPAILGLWDFWGESRFGSNLNVGDQLLLVAVSGGTSNTTIAAETKGYNWTGLRFMSHATTVNSGFRFSTASEGVWFGQLSAKYRTQLVIPSQAGRTVRFGFHDATSAADAVDGVYFEISGDSASGKTALNSVRSQTSAFALTGGNAYTFEIDVNEAGTQARYRIFEAKNETAVFDRVLTTNISTSNLRACSPNFIATLAAPAAITHLLTVFSLGYGTVQGYKRATGRS